METKPTGAAGSSRAAVALFNRIKEILQDIFDMPATEQPTLPQLFLTRTGISCWPLASLAVGGSIYLVFFLIAWLDGTLAGLVEAGQVWNSLRKPVMIGYLFLIQPPLRRLLRNAIDTFVPLMPPTEYRYRLARQAYGLNRTYEWTAIALAVGLGWMLDPPWTGNDLSPANLVYNLLGGGLVSALIGWHIYAALARTRVLAVMYRQAENVDIFKENVSFWPILHWSLGVIGVLLAGIVIGALFIDPEDIRGLNAVVVYTILILAVGLVLFFSKAPASLFSQVSMFRALFLFLLAVVGGTVGFVYLEEWDIEQALYATVITMTTVGYGDLTPTNSTSRFFAIGLSLVAVGIAGYAFSSVAAFIVETNIGRLLRGQRVYKLISRLNHHIILCGAGRVGRQIAIELYKTRTPFVLIEQDPVVLDSLLREIEIPYLEGNATLERVLTLAGIERASGLVTTFKDDKANAFVVLTARETAKKLDNPHLRITTRVNDEKQTKKLQRAGANITISPKAVGGRRMAGMMLSPKAFTFLDEMVQAEQQTGQTLRLEEVYAGRINHPLLLEQIETDQLTVALIGQHTGLLVVAIKRFYPDQQPTYDYLYTPRGDTKIEREDLLIVLGTPQERARLRDETEPNFLEILQTTVDELWSRWQGVTSAKAEP